MARKGENITHRKDKRWEARIITGRKENGKAKYSYIYAHSYQEVKKKKEQFIINSQFEKKQEQTQPSQIRIETLVNEFLKYKRIRIKESSYAHYWNVTNNHIIPYFGNMYFCDLKMKTIEEFTAAELNTGNLRTNQGLSVKMVKDILIILHSIIQYAYLHGYTSAEIVRLDFPREIVEPIRTLTEEEQKLLEHYCLMNYDCEHFCVYLCLYTGLRIGEICALKWSDIDWNHNVIFIQRTILRISNTEQCKDCKTKVIITSPKSEKGIRKIPVPSFLQQHLKYFYQLALDEETYVLTGGRNYMEPNNYYRKYKRWLHKCNMESYNFHSLRHTFATNCILTGCDPKSLSELLGHSNVKLTLNRYVHPSMDTKREYLERLH